MTGKRYDLISMGRSSIDLYSNDIGAAFEDISTFSAFVGGCPTNVAVGSARLGLKTLLLTAVGVDPVGDFVLSFLKKQAIETAFIPRKLGHRTSAVLLGIEPPDKFPLVFYRDNCADFQLTIDDVEATPISQARLLLISGTGLSQEPSRSATLRAMELARAANVEVVLDLDFRADQWSVSAGDTRAYGVTIRSILHMVDIAVGTEEELKAAILTYAGQVAVTDSQMSAPAVSGNLEQAIAVLLAGGVKTLVVKRGSAGATVYDSTGKQFSAPPFAVEVCNVLGAGDAFAAGFLYAHLKGWDWSKCVRMGNATGAIVVTRQGCANFMPYEQEALDFIESRGGFAMEEVSCHP